MSPAPTQTMETTPGSSRTQSSDTKPDSSQTTQPTRSEQPGQAKPGRLRRPSDLVVSAGATALLLLLLGVVAEIGAANEWWRASTLPAPSTTIAEAVTLLQEQQFWSDAGRTGLEIFLAIIFGSTLGFVAGLVFWKLPTVGRIFEPYLVSFYAVPLVLFYPVMIVLVGINASSVVILATIMAAIPMALNTTVGLNGIRPVYLKLARSLQCTPRQMLTQIALPAAAPFIVAGLRLGVVYALIGSIAMEFVTAQAGLGYRIRYLYEIFDSTTMFAYILVVLVLSILLTALLALAERLIVKGRTT